MAATATFLQATASSANQTTYTFTSQNLGTASSDRYIIAHVVGTPTVASGISTVTIGGVSATKIDEQIHAVNTSNSNSLWIASVPTGTTGNVVVTFNSLSARCGIELWSAIGLGSATPYDTGKQSVKTTNPAPTTSIDCEADGFIISGSFMENFATTSGQTWAGVTEQNNTQVEANSYTSGGSDNFASAQSALSVTCTWSHSTTAEASIVSASWSGTGGGAPAFIPRVTYY